MGCYQFCCLVNRGTAGVNSFPKTVTQQRNGCDLNPGPSVPEPSTLTNRLPSYPLCNSLKFIQHHCIVLLYSTNNSCADLNPEPNANCNLDLPEFSELFIVHNIPILHNFLKSSCYKNGDQTTPANVQLRQRKKWLNKFTEVHLQKSCLLQFKMRGLAMKCNTQHKIICERTGQAQSTET